MAVCAAERSVVVPPCLSTARACLDRPHLRAHALWEDKRRPVLGRTRNCCLFALDSLTSTPIHDTLTRLWRIAKSHLDHVWPGQSSSSLCTFGKVLLCFRFQFPTSKTLDPLAHSHLSASILHFFGLRTWQPSS